MAIYKAEGKKDGLQKYYVRVAWTDENGHHQTQRTTYGKAEAQALEYKLLAQNKKSPSQRLTVNGLYQDYIAVKTHDVRDTTLEKMKTSFRLHILPILGNVRLDNMNAKTLQSWKNKINETNLATVSKNNLYRDLRAMLNYAVKMDYLQKSPLSKIDRFRDAYEQPKTEKLHYYTPDEFKRFEAVAKEKCTSQLNYSLYVFFIIAYFTGMRKGEINALRWEDIDGDILHVKRSVNVKGSQPRETPPKTASSFRDIQIPDPLITVLDEQNKRQHMFKRFSKHWRVCGGWDYLADTTIDKFNRECAEAAGLHHIRVHDFRHSHASLLANSGINIQEIARRLGHSNVQLTWNTYSHLYPKEEERALKVLNDIKI